MNIKRTADTILMVRPYDFGFNEQTGVDNEFQNRIQISEQEINRRANEEFQGMVDTLRNKGVNVLLLEPPKVSTMKTPDAIFPNNWFSTEHDGTLITYPMMAENRKAERRLEDVEALLVQNGYHIRNLINVGRYNETDRFLEGTGCLIIDHGDEVVYAAQSARCHPEQFENFLKLRFYKEGILFETRSSTGKPVYHTNVIMSLGEDFALICSECIAYSEQRERVMRSLKKSFSDVIEISLKQVEESFCGNILAVRNDEDKPLIVMSQRAYNGFTPEQIKRLESHGELVPVSINTIETVGGGSARCMMAEIYSSKMPGKQNSSYD